MQSVIIDLGTFDSAHQLPTHSGKCKNLHGHTYRVQATITGEVVAFNPKDSSSGMVSDFGVLKDIWKTRVMPLFDHRLILGYHPLPWISALKPDFYDYCFDHAESESYPRHWAHLVEPIPEWGETVVINAPLTTAETLAYIFHGLLNAYWAEVETDAHISQIQVWETPSSSAINTRL